VVYKAREPDRDTKALIQELEPVVGGLGFAIVELSLYRRGRKADSAQVRLVINGPGNIGTGELSRIHRAVLPRLELALEGKEIYLELSSPGIDRLIKDGAEFRHYTGKTVKCWITGADSWVQGVLRGSEEDKILLETEEGIKKLDYKVIAKARLGG
jgi:ribosome maturation factor RimP